MARQKYKIWILCHPLILLARPKGEPRFTLRPGSRMSEIRSLFMANNPRESLFFRSSKLAKNGCGQAGLRRRHQRVNERPTPMTAANRSRDLQTICEILRKSKICEIVSSGNLRMELI